MSWLLTALAAVAAALFAFLLTSALLTGNWLAALIAGLGLALALPWPGRSLFASAGTWQAPLRAFLGVVLLGLFGWALIGGGATSIYQSPEIRDRFHAMYRTEMKAWPLFLRSVALHSNGFMWTQGRPVRIMEHPGGMLSWTCLMRWKSQQPLRMRSGWLRVSTGLLR